MRRLLSTFCFLIMAMYVFSACGRGNPGLVGVWKVGIEQEAVAYYSYNSDGTVLMTGIEGEEECTLSGTYTYNEESGVLCQIFTQAAGSGFCLPPDSEALCQPLEWHSDNVILLDLMMLKYFWVPLCRTDGIGTEGIEEIPDLCLTEVAPECGEHGECTITSQLLMSCTCFDGYTGFFCNLPPT